MQNITNAPSVSYLIKQIKNKLESNFNNLNVSGEIFSITRSASGHVYISLNDQYASLSCVVFKNDFKNIILKNELASTLKKGDKIIISGSISVYVPRGNFQFIIKNLVLDGVGQLELKFNLLKRKLASDGLFDLEAKKEIVAMPARIAIITSLHAAALGDFLKIFSRRSPMTDILISPALVQGESAAKSIVNSLQRLIMYNMNSINNSNFRKIDVVVITRGGGSLEDLWCFNDEELAWEIFNCPIPIVSAVGHERDFTICDLVSDLRMETPSAAAEKLSQKGYQLKSHLNELKNNMLSKMAHNHANYKNFIYQCRPDKMYYNLNNILNGYKKRMLQLEKIKTPLSLLGINDYRLRLDDTMNKIISLIQVKLAVKIEKINSLHELLQVLNPIAILDRGYTLTRTEENNIIKSTKEFNEIKSHSVLKIQFADGEKYVQKI